MIRRYIIWRNKNAADERLREVITRANVVWCGITSPDGLHVPEAVTPPDP